MFIYNNTPKKIHTNQINHNNNNNNSSNNNFSSKKFLVHFV